MVRKILRKPNSLLKGKSTDISYDSIECKEIIRDLFDTWRSDKSPKGMAAPQIGKSVSIILCRLKGIPYLMINPRIVRKSYIKLNSNEGCESVDHRYNVKRPLWLIVEYTNESGKIERKFCSWDSSRVVSHEVDHLYGICISDIGTKCIGWRNL